LSPPHPPDLIRSHPCRPLCPVSPTVHRPKTAKRPGNLSFASPPSRCGRNCGLGAWHSLALQLLLRYAFQHLHNDKREPTAEPSFISPRSTSRGQISLPTESETQFSSSHRVGDAGQGWLGLTCPRQRKTQAHDKTPPTTSRPDHRIIITTQGGQITPKVEGTECTTKYIEFIFHFSFP
jgi:hypothetical protein